MPPRLKTKRNENIDMMKRGKGGGGLSVGAGVGGWVLPGAFSAFPFDFTRSALCSFAYANQCRVHWPPGKLHKQEPPPSPALFSSPLPSSDHTPFCTLRNIQKSLADSKGENVNGHKRIAIAIPQFRLGLFKRFKENSWMFPWEKCASRFNTDMTSPCLTSKIYMIRFMARNALQKYWNIF